MRFRSAPPLVLVGVTGSIAAYRAADLVSRLSKEHRVAVLMTRAARRFVAPLTFETLSHRRVVTSLWDADSDDPEHIALAREAACLIVAPATANILAKLAVGLADDALSTVALAVTCPVVVAPAMNTRMWEHPTVRENLATLKRRGILVVPPATGVLACREEGAGKIADTGALVAAVRTALTRGGSRKGRERGTLSREGGSHG